MAAQIDQAGLQARVIRAFKGDGTLFDEVLAKPELQKEAYVIVAIGAISSGLGVGLGGLIFSGGRGFVSGFLMSAIGALVAYVVWGYALSFVGKQMYKTTLTPIDALRVIGYAQAPRIAGILLIIPGLNIILGLVLFIYAVYLAYLAVQRSMGLPQQPAIITLVVSAVLAFVAQAIVGSILAAILFVLIVAGL